MKLAILDAATLGEGLDFGVLDRFGEVGPTPWLQEAFHLKAADIVEKAEKVVTRKK